jgi:pectinesterase
MLMINVFSAQSKRAVGLSNRYTPSLEPVAEGNACNITVASDGTGDATTLQQAIDHVPQGNTHRFVIHIKPGTYKEQIKILHTQPYVTFRGEDPLKTTITFNLSARTSGDTRNSYTAYIGGNDFRA